MTKYEGWIISQYTGDPYKDRKFVWGKGSLNASGVATINPNLTTVESVVALGTTASDKIYSDSQAGTAVVFKGTAGAAGEFYYLIIGKKV